MHYSAPGCSSGFENKVASLHLVPYLHQSPIQVQVFELEAATPHKIHAVPLGSSEIQ